MGWRDHTFADAAFRIKWPLEDFNGACSELFTGFVSTIFGLCCFFVIWWVFVRPKGSKFLPRVCAASLGLGKEIKLIMRRVICLDV